MLCSVYQRYNSKAIHNPVNIAICMVPVVLSLSKIQFKSNSQPKNSNLHLAYCCAQSTNEIILDKAMQLIDLIQLKGPLSVLEQLKPLAKMQVSEEMNTETLAKEVEKFVRKTVKKK